MEHNEWFLLAGAAQGEAYNRHPGNGSESGTLRSQQFQNGGEGPFVFKGGGWRWCLCGISRESVQNNTAMPIGHLRCWVARQPGEPGLCGVGGGVTRPGWAGAPTTMILRAYASSAA
jgi:hypothetical protein